MGNSRPLLQGEAFATSPYWRSIRVSSQLASYMAEAVASRLCGPPIWLWFEEQAYGRPFALGKQLPWTAQEIDSVDRALKASCAKRRCSYEWLGSTAEPNFKSPDGMMVPRRLPSEEGQMRLKHLVERRVIKGTVLFRVDRKDREGLGKYKPWKTGFAVSS